MSISYSFSHIILAISYDSLRPMGLWGPVKKPSNSRLWWWKGHGICALSVHHHDLPHRAVLEADKNPLSPLSSTAQTERYAQETRAAGWMDHIDIRIFQAPEGHRAVTAAADHHVAWQDQASDRSAVSTEILVEEADVRMGSIAPGAWELAFPTMQSPPQVPCDQQFSTLIEVKWANRRGHMRSDEILTLIIQGEVYPITLWLCQNSYWKWPFIVDFPIKDGDFP